jgi:hyaluronan synthase
MFSFIVQLIDWFQFGKFSFFIIFYFYVWFIFSLKFITAAFYKNFQAPVSFQPRTSVIIPVVDEPIDLFTDVLNRITAQKPDEIIVVINGARNEKLEKVCESYTNIVRWFWIPKPGKRGALEKGILESNCEISVLVDSDTIWTPNTLKELVKPFYDNHVGGVTTKQKILDPDRNYLTRFADWLEDIRADGSMSGMSVTGQVGCLPGRTIAFRREILVRAMPDFMSEKFLGIRSEISDDRAFTNYTLLYGYKTVLQKSALVYTDAPTDLQKFIKQQVRWSKGSRYYTLKMMPWMLRNKPFLFLMYFNDLFGPFFLFGVIFNFVLNIILRQVGMVSLQGTVISNLAVVVTLTLISVFVSIGLRQIPHFINKPKDILFLGQFIFLTTFVLMPITVWGVMIVADDKGWGTRKNSYVGEKKFNIYRLFPIPLSILLLSALVVTGQTIEGRDKINWQIVSNNVEKVTSTTIEQVAKIDDTLITPQTEDKIAIAQTNTITESSNTASSVQQTISQNNELIQPTVVNTSGSQTSTAEEVILKTQESDQSSSSSSKIITSNSSASISKPVNEELLTIANNEESKPEYVEITVSEISNTVTIIDEIINQYSTITKKDLQTLDTNKAIEELNKKEVVVNAKIGDKISIAISELNSYFGK